MANLSLLKNVAAMAAASAVAVIGTTAKASAIEIYLGNGFSIPEIRGSVNYNVNGISLTATGTQASGASRNVYASLFGLGVTSRAPGILGTIGAIGSGENQIDGGITLGETLNLTFNNTAVRLISATFGRVGTNDNFKLLVDGNTFIAADIPGGNLLDFDIGKFSFNPAPTGRVFGFTVADNNDDYLVKYVEVEAVPEPITMAGIAVGSGFGVLLRRKYKKSISTSNQLSS